MDIMPDTGSTEVAGQDLSGFIKARHPDQGNGSPKGCNVQGHITGTPGPFFDLIDIDNGYWGLRRNATCISKPVTVQHDIPYNEHRCPDEIRHGCEGRCIHA